MVVDLPVGMASADHPEWVLPVDWTETHGLPPLEATLTTDGGLEIRPYTAGFGAMVSGSRDDPADHPHIGVALMRPKSARKGEAFVGRSRCAADYRASVRP